MQKTKTGFKTAACLSAAILLGASSASSLAAVIYDNTDSSPGQMTDQGNAEIGDIVQFTGTDRILTDFQFEYFLSPGASGNEMGQIFLRALDGPVVDGINLPGTLLYSSDTFNLRATADGYDRINLSGLAVNVPDAIAWTVSVTGVETTEEMGFLFYSDADSTGLNPTFLDDVTGMQEHFTIRRQADGSWDLLNHPGVEDNLNARFTAVPEPTTWALMLGGLGILGFMRRRAK